MKKTGWLILILLLAVMLIPICAGAECLHENLGTKEEMTNITYSSVDEYSHNKQGYWITVTYCLDCGAEVSRTDPSDSSSNYEAHSYVDQDITVTSQTCEQCKHVNGCMHESFYSGYSWNGEVEYTDTDSNARHLVSGAAFLYERCPNCGVWKNVQSVENYSVEDIHSYDVDGKCLNCKHQNTCGHENAKIIKSIYDFTTAECEPIENDNYHHLATGTGCEGTYCEDCETYFNTREHIEVTMEADHNYIGGVCEECSYECTHVFAREGTRKTEYEWRSTDQHLIRTYVMTGFDYCTICGVTREQAILIDSEILENHTDEDNDGVCDICQYGINEYIGWEVNDGILIISGQGAMENYSSGDATPWASDRSTIKRIVIDKNITSIGDYAFSGFTYPGLRVEFNQSIEPSISENAFTGTSNAVCRYFVNENWTGGNFGGENISWIYLPTNNEMINTGCINLNYQSGTGWSVYVEDELGGHSIPMTVEQVNEAAYGQYKALTFYAAPTTPEDLSVCSDWDMVTHIDIQPGCEWTLDIQLTDAAVLSYVSVWQSKSRLSITDPRTEGLYQLQVNDGTVNYTGRVQNLLLEGSFVPAETVTVAGNVDSLFVCGETLDAQYKGSLVVSGNVSNGFVWGKGSLDIPGVGTKTTDKMVVSSFNNANGEVIQSGVLCVDDLTTVTLSSDMYTFEYGFYDFEDCLHANLSLYMKLEAFEQIAAGSSIDNFTMVCSDINVRPNEIEWGQDVSVTFQTSEADGFIDLDGGRDEDGNIIGLYRVDVLTGNVRVNCPVNCIYVSNRRYETEPSVLEINGQVNFLGIEEIKSGAISIGENGSVQEGNWSRGMQANRKFGPVEKSGTLYSGSTLRVMSWNENESTRAIFPTEEEMKEAANITSENITVQMNVGDSSEEGLLPEEAGALENYLNEAGLSGQAVVSVFDASLTQYTVSDDGELTEIGAITDLDEPVLVTVNNPTQNESCYIVRIHEDEENNITVVPVSEETEEAEIPFSSDLFSKYAIIASHMETDPCVHEDLDGDGYCDQCGVKMEWAYDISSTGVLTIRGAGATDDYTEASELPWYNDLYRISRVIIEEGITRIGDHVLDGLNGMARVDFCQTVKPTVSETAFGTSNVKCRYYSTNASWTDAPEEWVFLPTGEPLDDSNYHVAYDADGWHVYISQPYKEYSGLTAAQAAEMSYRNQNGTLYALPPEEEFWTVFTSGGVTFIGTEDEDQQYTLTVPDNRVLELSIRNPKLELTINDTIVGGGNIGLTVGDGTTVYYGTLCSLNLNGMTAYAYVGITGDLNSLSMNAPGSQDAPLGTVNIGGKIVNGSVYGTCDLVIPGISEPIPLGSVVTGSIADTDINGNFIVDGELLVPLEIAKSPTVDDYKLEYRRIEGKWNLSAEPKGNGSFASAYDLESIDPTFGITKLYWSPDTRLTINSDETITVSGRTAEERGEDVVDLANVTIYRGNITVNCPVGSVHIPSTFYGSTEPIALSIGGAVEELTFNLTHPDSRIFLTGGSVNGGEWGRPFGYNRTFGAVSGESVLFADGTLGVLSARSGQTMQAILPDNTTLADAMPNDNPLGEGEKVLMDVSEGNVSDVVYDEGCMAALQELGIAEEDIVSAFDVSLCTYTEQGGSVQEGRPVENLKDSVSVTVTNTTAENVCIVRLHEENDAVTADQLTEFSTEPTQTFESDKFSKYLLVKNNETVDPDMLDTLRLPAGLTKIEANAFEGGAFEAVIVPDGCTEIGAEAFKDCHNLVYFSYPAEMTIDPSAFDGCNVKVWDLRNVTQ